MTLTTILLFEKMANISQNLHLTNLGIPFLKGFCMKVASPDLFSKEPVTVQTQIYFIQLGPMKSFLDRKVAQAFLLRYDPFNALCSFAPTQISSSFDVTLERKKAF